MSNWEDRLAKRQTRPPATRLDRFPLEARESIRDQLHRVRLQMEVLGLTEAEHEINAAIVAVCAGLNIPNLLTVEQIIGQHRAQSQRNKH